MSETKHSPEPWALASSLDYSPAINDADGDCLVAATDFPNTADRRRIVACVNACAGIPTEALNTGRLEEALGLLENISRATVNGFEAAHMAKRAFAALRALGRLPP